MCENFPNFSFDPNCLLFSGSTIDKNSLNVSTLPDTQVFHETTIIFAHINGIPVKPLLLNYSRYRDEFPSWRLNCAQILVFSRTRNIVQYYDEIVNWGNRNNVVIYATLTLGSLKAFMQSKFRNFVSTMRIPIYVIILQFAGEENTDNVVIYAALFSPTQGFQHWEEFPSAGGKLFPSPGELTSLRRMENYNHENHRLPLKLVWRVCSITVGLEEVKFYIFDDKKNPTMSSVLIWHFFTIVDEYVWLVCFLVSFILGVTRLGEFTDLCVAFVRQGMRKRKKSLAAVLAILGITILSSWYDAYITCQITKPLEKYVIGTISEIFNEFGFKFHSAHLNRDVEMFRMSLRRLDGISPNLTKFYEISGAAIFADDIAFEPTSDHIQLVLYFLKSNYPNVTCNIVKEIFYKRNVVWEFRYFGGNQLLAVLQTLSSNGIFKLYENLWKFVDQRHAREHPIIKSTAIGTFQNLLVAFQLYLVCIIATGFSFIIEYGVGYRIKRSLIVMKFTYV
ncbi:hypothetical protein Fcan01_16241 [Folsomia candida]|uniref:Uncharacterized protein n=1 Tax=Folsomia candida TaxID=158441 RepID=A0A226DVB3_FOLCA|nr:hypothetical protein Fcan01_16241 [Folsomia candida]